MEPEKTHKEKVDKPDQQLFVQRNYVIQRNMLKKGSLVYVGEDDPVSQGVKNNEAAEREDKSLLSFQIFNSMK